MQTSERVIEQIREHIASGEICQFRAPTRGGVLPPFDDDAAWNADTILAEDLVDLLVSPDLPRHRKGTRLIGLRIVGDLDLSFARLENQVSLNWCQFGRGTVDLSDAATRTVDLEGSVCRRLLAGHSNLGCIGVCIGVTLCEPDGRAIDAELADISSNVILSGLNAQGAVWLLRAAIGGQLLCQGGTITSPAGIALDAGGARFAGVSLEGVAVQGSVRLPGAKIGGQLSCSGTIIANSGGIAFDASGVEVDREVFLDEGFAACGEVNLTGARVGGSLTCRTGSFLRPHGDALNLHSAEIADAIGLDEGFNAYGRVVLDNTTIGNSLICRNGIFTNPHGPALTVDGAEIDDDVDLISGFVADGEVSLVGARIGGQLSCQGGRFIHPEGNAIFADRVEIGGGMHLIKGFVADGEVRLLGAKIGGQLVCKGGTFTSRGDALAAESAEIAGGVFLDEGFTAHGTVDLQDVRCPALRDDRASWPRPGQLKVRGMRFDRLDGPAQSWRDRRDWLRLQPSPTPQPYRQLATVFRSDGDDKSARMILMERHSAPVRRGRPAHWRSEDPSWRHRWWRRFLGVSIGHGYTPWRALWFLIPVLVIMWVWYASAIEHDLLVPTRANSGALASECTDAYPCVNPLVYAVETLVPVVEFGQKSAWIPAASHDGSPFWNDGAWLSRATWITAVLGWVFATLIIAGFTSFIRRD